jgi:hypothetical protein
MVLEGCQEAADPFDQSIVDFALVLERLDLVLALLTLGVDLVLLRTNEGALVDVGVDFDIRVIAELESVLYSGEECISTNKATSLELRVTNSPICYNRPAFC